MHTPESQSSQVVLTSKELQSLLQRCDQQDEQALEALYQATSPFLHAVQIRLLGAGAIAEEALQDTFIKIWQTAGTYNSDCGQPITWMTSIARYHALDLLRTGSVVGDGVVSGHTNGVEDRVNSTIEPGTVVGDSSPVEVCLGTLEEIPRECIVKAYSEGDSLEELSDKYEKPLGTVKSRFRRALLTLRECMNELP